MSCRQECIESDCMNIQFLIDQARRLQPDPSVAVDAMVKLARLYGEGGGDVKADLRLAYRWANMAAKYNSPEGYVELSKIIGAACIVSSDLELKLTRGKHLIERCDEPTLLHHGNILAACNVGVICEYLSDWLDERDGQQAEVERLRMLASRYYQLCSQISKSVKIEGDVATALKSAQLGSRRLVVKASLVEFDLDAVYPVTRSTERKPIEFKK